MTNTNAKWISAATLLLALFPMVVHGQDITAIPPELALPPSAKLILHAKGKGDQVYTCRANNSQFSWILKEPQAELFDENGKVIGHHFAGPAWQLSDKSLVTGKVVARVNSTSADAIPWLLLTAVDHSGSGLLTRVTDIQRLNTSGGKAPDTGCDAEHIGNESRVPYSADYYFFSK